MPRERFELSTIEGALPFSTPQADLSGFKDFCLVDLQLVLDTYRKYAGYVKRFLEYTRGHRLDDISIVRAFLKSSPNNGNALRALKAYFKFIGCEEVVSSFRFPRWPHKIRCVTKNDLQIFYDALCGRREKALFLFYATSGLRKMEVLSLRTEDIDFRSRIIIPKNHQGSQTKHSLVSFYNGEAEKALNEYLPTRNKRARRLFAIGHKEFCKMWREAREKTGINISCQDLRFWFSSEMGSLGVQDRYVDAFCGRVPRSVLARHYTDYSPERLREVYEKANLKILDEQKEQGSRIDALQLFQR